jgi:hypothetical protein
MALSTETIPTCRDGMAAEIGQGNTRFERYGKL